MRSPLKSFLCLAFHVDVTVIFWKTGNLNKPHNNTITITEEKFYASEQQRQHSKRNGLIKDQHVAMNRKSESRYICIWLGYIYMNNRYWGQQITAREATAFHLEYRAGWRAIGQEPENQGPVSNFWSTLWM